MNNRGIMDEQKENLVGKFVYVKRDKLTLEGYLPADLCMTQKSGQFEIAQIDINIKPFSIALKMPEGFGKRIIINNTTHWIWWVYFEDVVVEGSEEFKMCEKFTLESNSLDTAQHATEHVAQPEPEKAERFSKILEEYIIACIKSNEKSHLAKELDCLFEQLRSK